MRKKWFNASKTKTRSNSFTGSLTSRSELDPKRGTMLNPKLLEMVIKTINKRPSIAGEFQRGLAKTATQTWNTHLAERKKTTKKQKAVEEIASNLGLAKGFRTEFHDEAERLVSILFKEIEKKKKDDDESSSDESSSSSLEEESDQSIESLSELREPEQVTKPPPKTPIRKPRAEYKVQPHADHAPYVTRRRSISVGELKGVTGTTRGPPKLGMSFINVTEIRVRDSLEKEAKTERMKSIPRVYMEVMKRKSVFTPIIRKEIPKKGFTKASMRIKRKDLIPGLQLEKKELEKKEIVKKTQFRIDPEVGRKSVLGKYLDVKGVSETGSDQELEPIPDRLREPIWRGSRGRSLMGQVTETPQHMDRLSRVSLTIPEKMERTTSRRSTKTRLSSRILGEMGEEQFDEKTKQYVIQQIKDMLDMITSARGTSELEIVRQKRRQRKSIFILWKNYLDIRHWENVAEQSVGHEQSKRESLLREVDLQLKKTSLYARLSMILGEESTRSPFELMLWSYLNEKAKQINDEKERINDKMLDNTIQVLKEQLMRSRTPKNVLLEEERRRKALDDYMARLITPREKYVAKRPNTKETTMEEILQMRGFRGPPRNCKNTIWIKKPEFIDYLKPLRSQRKIFNDPSRIKHSKPDSVRKGGICAVTKPERRYSSEYIRISFPHIISIERTPVVDKNSVPETPHPIPEKRLGPCAKEEHGFRKYFGNLNN